MPTTFELGDFNKALKIVSRAVLPDSFAPEFGLICLQLRGNRAAFFSANDKLAFRTESHCAGDLTEDLYVPGDKLIKYFSTFDPAAKGKVLVKPTDKQVVFSTGDGGHLTVTKPATVGSFYKLVKSGDKVMSLDADFFAACNLFLTAGGSDEARPATTHSLINFALGIIWTLSGPILAEYKLPSKLPNKKPLIVPNLFLKAAKSLFDANGTTFDLSYSDKKVAAFAHDRSVQIEHAVQPFVYPNIEPNLKPFRKCTDQVSLSKGDFVARFSRIGIMLTEAEREFAFNFKNGVLEMGYTVKKDDSNILERIRYKGKYSGTWEFNYDMLKPFVDAMAKLPAKDMLVGFPTGVFGIAIDIGEPFLFTALSMETVPVP